MVRHHIPDQQSLGLSHFYGEWHPCGDNSALYVTENSNRYLNRFLHDLWVSLPTCIWHSASASLTRHLSWMLMPSLMNQFSISIYISMMYLQWIHIFLSLNPYADPFLTLTIILYPPVSIKIGSSVYICLCISIGCFVNGSKCSNTTGQLMASFPKLGIWFQHTHLDVVVIILWQ